MNKVEIKFLWIVGLFFWTGWLSAATTIKLAVCEGGSVRLEIPDCEGSDNCCISWIDGATDLPLVTATRACTYIVPTVISDLRYKAIVTKENLGNTEEFLFIISVIDPDVTGFFAEPKDCCYNAGEPLSLDNFNISISDADVLGDVVFTPVSVSPNLVKTYPERQQGKSSHTVTFACHETIKELEVKLDVVNEEIEVPTLNNVTFKLNLDFKKALKENILKPAKNKFFNAMFNALPDISLESGVSEVTFKKCCKDYSFNCITDQSRMEVSLFQFGASKPIVNGSLKVDEIVTLLKDVGVELPFDFKSNTKFDVKLSLGIENNTIPDFTFETGCETTLKHCITWGSSFKVELSFTPKSVGTEITQHDFETIRPKVKITWPQELKYCWPGGGDIESTDIGCPTVEVEGKLMLVTLLEVGTDFGKKEFFPELFGVDCN